VILPAAFLIAVTGPATAARVEMNAHIRSLTRGSSGSLDGEMAGQTTGMA